MDDFTIISSYTNEQAIEDGIKVKLAPDIYATTNALRTITPDAFTDEGFDHRIVIEAFLDAAKTYDNGIYCDASATYPDEANANHAVYSVLGHEVWFIRDGEGLHILLPEDY